MRTTFYLILTLLFVSCNEQKEPVSNESNNTETSDKKENAAPEIDLSSLSKLNKEELRIQRNTIFAKYGKQFESADLKSYFSKQPWYNINPDFKDEQMAEKDKRLVTVINYYEQAEKILWQQNVDLDGDGKNEVCAAIKLKGESKFSLHINEESREYRLFWEENDTEAPEYWTKVTIKVIDINKADKNKEIHISQHFAEYVDPGIENILLSYIDKKLLENRLSSQDYNSGELQFDGKGSVEMRVSFCPDHRSIYAFNAGKLSKQKDIKGKVPEGGCPACFSADALVMINEKESMPISSLKKGDQVLSYDYKENVYFTTQITGILAVQHEDLVRLVFDEGSVVTTLDHPFLIKNKGWCSLHPTKTLNQYTNYSEVDLLQLNDMFEHVNGKVVRLIAIERINAQQKTYTIVSLEKGATFIVNGLVVGTEELRKVLP